MRVEHYEHFIIDLWTQNLFFIYGFAEECTKEMENDSKIIISIVSFVFLLSLLKSRCESMIQKLPKKAYNNL